VLYVYIWAENRTSPCDLAHESASYMLWTSSICEATATN